MAEDVCGPSVPHLQGKTFHYKIQNVEPIILTNTPQGILDIYKNVPLCYDLMHINDIGFLNTISQHIMFSIVSMIKNRKLKNNEDVIKQVKKLYIQHGPKITRVHADSEFEPLCV